jgi:hypothetical protein
VWTTPPAGLAAREKKGSRYGTVPGLVAAVFGGAARPMTSAFSLPLLAGPVSRADGGVVRSGSQNWSDDGVLSGVVCGALAAAAKRLRKARLAAAPDGS